ncbi:unknown [Proteobacteria bacterium CAG:495]|nr:unknown [Proteobacteria bacterium CAG:495]
MSFVMIPEELLEVDISAAQLRALIHIINNTYSSGKYAGCCCLGYQNLADLCYTHKGAAINTLKQLEQLGFIEINRRDRFNRSNAIRLTLENGYERCRSKSGDCSDNNLERSLNRTDERSLNRTLGSLNRTEGSLNRTPHKDLKFKNQDLKTKNARVRVKEGSLNRTLEDNQIAPTDVAVGRSMPDGGQAAKSSAGNEEVSAGAAKTKNQILVDDMRAAFTDIFADLSLSMAGNTYILRKKGKYALIEDVRLREVLYWMMRRGLDARILDPNTRVLGETLLEEVA